MTGSLSAPRSSASATRPGARSRRVQLWLAGFNALSAFGGAISLLVAEASGPLPAGLRGPFPSIVAPALLLGIVIGGTQLLAFFACLLRRPRAPLAIAVAGFGMVIWIFVEVCLLLAFSPLHALYFTTGLAQLGVLLLQLGLCDHRSGSVHGSGPDRRIRPDR